MDRWLGCGSLAEFCSGGNYFLDWWSLGISNRSSV